MARPDPTATGTEAGTGTSSGDGSLARPLRADARRNRERVLEAARAAFGAEGSDVSLDDIARRAGVGAGTVYRHFATKDALFEAVVLDRIGELVEEAHALADDPDPGRAFLSFVELLARAQYSTAVRRDINVSDVMALMTGTAYAMCLSRSDDEQSRRLLAIMSDGLRADRTAEGI